MRGLYVVQLPMAGLLSAGATSSTLLASAEPALAFGDVGFGVDVALGGGSGDTAALVGAFACSRVAFPRHCWSLEQMRGSLRIASMLADEAVSATERDALLDCPRKFLDYISRIYLPSDAGLRSFPSSLVQWETLRKFKRSSTSLTLI